MSPTFSIPATDVASLTPEIVLVVAGASKDEEDLPAEAIRTLGLLVAELPLKKAAALTAEIHGLKKNALYKLGLEQASVCSDGA